MWVGSGEEGGYHLHNTALSSSQAGIDTYLLVKFTNASRNSAVSEWIDLELAGQPICQSGGEPKRISLNLGGRNGCTNYSRLDGRRTRHSKRLCNIFHCSAMVTVIIKDCLREQCYELSGFD